MLDGFVLLSVGLKLRQTELDWTPAALWLAVVASGLYHGVNPGMGWPLAVSAGLMERSSRAMAAAFWPLTAGHFLAMLVVILPFSLLVAVVEWQRQIEVGAGLLVFGFGIFRFIKRRHPRVLARIRPTQLGLWSFAVAIAHGAGLMLVPIYLGLCRAADLDRGHAAAGAIGATYPLGAPQPRSARHPTRPVHPGHPERRDCRPLPAVRRATVEPLRSTLNRRSRPRRWIIASTGKQTFGYPVAWLDLPRGRVS